MPGLDLTVTSQRFQTTASGVKNHPALYAAGYTVAEIAGMVGVTEETVRQHCGIKKLE